ncbi:MAG: polysaccharide export protein [Alphaproteobacteria bacterium]|nr:polysaccharide export protein [Alphaproteobacteria bacterium]
METPQTETVTVTGLRPSEDTTYHLGTGDTVRVTVFGETDLSGEFQIDSQGYVRLPLIGQVPAEGLSTYELESRVAAALTQGSYLINPRVSVEVTTYRPFYIIGEVAKPGEYPYVNAMSVPNAIALAGGYTELASESTVYIRHQGQVKGQEVPADESTRVRPGDVVRVERTTYWSIITLLAPIISPFTSVAYLLK